MSDHLVDRNPDLSRLRDEGYAIQIVDERYLLVHDIPYIGADLNIKLGIIVTPIEMSGQYTVAPGDHKVHFIGEHPRNSKGVELEILGRAGGASNLTSSLVVDRTFSNKPTESAFIDHYDKVVHYINLIEPSAQVIKPRISAITNRVFPDAYATSIHNYPDTNASRAGIGILTEKLRSYKVAIIGLGGTGSYLLDFLAKTEVASIDLYDADTFATHNAYRSPGAPTFKTLNRRLKKVHYLKSIYKNMHPVINAHSYDMSKKHFKDLARFDFVFVSIDTNEAKKDLLEELVRRGITFIDVGMGVDMIDGKLSATLRTSVVGNAVEFEKVSPLLVGVAPDDEYKQNIQIAELNAINAAYAILKWKQITGLYHDLDVGNQLLFNTDTMEVL